jgi:hypothetical protein
MAPRDGCSDGRSVWAALSGIDSIDLLEEWRNILEEEMLDLSRVLSERTRRVWSMVVAVWRRSRGKRSGRAAMSIEVSARDLFSWILRPLCLVFKRSKIKGRYRIEQNSCPVHYGLVLQVVFVSQN